MIVSKVYNDSICALKEGRKDDRQVLSSLYSIFKNKMIELRTNTLSDEESLKLIQKFIKTLDDEILAFTQAKRDDKVIILNKQKTLILKYLPKMLSEDEIKNEILNLPDRTIPNVMKHFKTNFAGKVDMKLVNTILKTL